MRRASTGYQGRRGFCGRLETDMSVSRGGRRTLLRRTSITIAVAVTIVLQGSVEAHHGTSTYDMNTESVLSGTVKEWTFGNPHTWLWLNVTTPRGSVEEWSIESAPPNYLSRQGWTSATLRSGERITALVSPSRGEPRRAILLEVRRSDGTTLIVRPRGSFGRPASIPPTNSSQ